VVAALLAVVSAIFNARRIKDSGGEKTMQGIGPVTAVAIALLTLIHNGAGAADEYPTRTITIIVPLPPGGGTDILARLLASHLEQKWKRPVVVDNRPGGGSVMGSVAVVRAEPDGHTLLFTASSLTAMKATLKTPPFDVEKSFEPISLVHNSPFVAGINANLPVQTMEEFLRYAKANPGKINYGTVSIGAALVSELFKKKAGVEIVQIPFRGSAPMVAALAQGEIQFGLDAMITLNPLIESRRVRAIAVSSAQRWPALPNLPTIAEAGVPGFEATFWFGLLAPARTPADVVNKLAEQVHEFVRRPETASRMQTLGYNPLGGSPDEFRTMIQREVKQWNDIATDVNLEKQ
jgi:tripartite-type tricarboxylate transporter receptor subunit TctC